jgi:hypothetical protein
MTIYTEILYEYIKIYHVIDFYIRFSRQISHKVCPHNVKILGILVSEKG